MGTRDFVVRHSWRTLHRSGLGPLHQDLAQGRSRGRSPRLWALVPGDTSVGPSPRPPSAAIYDPGETRKERRSSSISSNRGSFWVLCAPVSHRARPSYGLLRPQWNCLDGHASSRNYELHGVQSVLTHENDPPSGSGRCPWMTTNQVLPPEPPSQPGQAAQMFGLPGLFQDVGLPRGHEHVPECPRGCRTRFRAVVGPLCDHVPADHLGHLAGQRRVSVGGCAAYGLERFNSLRRRRRTMSDADVSATASTKTPRSLGPGTLTGKVMSSSWRR